MKTKKIIIWVLIAIVVICVLTGIGVLTAVCISAGNTFVPEKSDCIIVLGAHIWEDGTLSNVLTYRCESALTALRDGIAPVIIVCGAQGKGEPTTEAAAMRQWMIDHGTPEDVIIVEEQSANTIQNLINARAIMKKNGWNTAAVCTSNYHLTRALWLARDIGLDATGIAAPSTRDVISLVRGRLRETCSWILYFLRKL